MLGSSQGHYVVAPKKTPWHRLGKGLIQCPLSFGRSLNFYHMTKAQIPKLSQGLMHRQIQIPEYFHQHPKFLVHPQVSTEV